MLDYQAGILQTRYAGPATEKYIHQLHVTSEHDLKTFSGFSGSPAYMIPERDGTLGDTDLIGMVIQRMPQSGLVRIVGTEAIRAMIERSHE